MESQTTSPIGWHSLGGILTWVCTSVKKGSYEYIWRPAHTGNFSTSSAWDMLHHAQVSNIPFKTFWNPIVTVKILVFIWRLWDNAVAVDEV